jgi:hypothetical protein
LIQRAKSYLADNDDDPNAVDVVATDGRLLAVFRLEDVLIYSDRDWGPVLERNPERE